MCESRLFTTESLHGPLLAVPCEGALADVNCDTQAINGRYTALMADEPAVWGVLNDWRLRGDSSRQGIITEPVTRVWRIRWGRGHVPPFLNSSNSRATRAIGGRVCRGRHEPRTPFGGESAIGAAAERLQPSPTKS